MDSSILLGASALFAFLFAMYSMLRARRDNAPIGFFEYVLAIIATLVLILTLVFDNLGQAELGRLEFTVVGYAVVIGILGWFIRRGERQSEPQPAQSRAVLSYWVTILVIIAAIAIPFYAQSVPEVAAQQQVAIPTPINAEPSLGDTSLALAIMPTQTPVELANTIPTPELPALYFSSPTPTPENLVVCDATVTTNLNVRSYPAVAQGNIITVFVGGSDVSVVGRNGETSWLYVVGEEHEGWVSADVVETEAECGEIPVRQWRTQ